MKRIIFVSLVLILSTSFVFAQNDVSLDEITPEDLGVIDPKLLPDSPLYFLKEWGRGLGNFLTFNPVKKVERQLRHANEKLIEARKLAEKKENEEIATRAMENYQNIIGKVEGRIEQIREREKNNPKFQKLVDKFSEDSLKHRRLTAIIRNKFNKEEKQGETQIANPASVYCEEQGGKLRMEQTDKGTHGICVLQNGTECEEWLFFRKQCGGNLIKEKEIIKEKKKPTQNTNRSLLKIFQPITNTISPKNN
ncbi:DUF333 domain-containing protein [Patescibacteria group bacterium]